jgi:hypothetical protein
MPLQTRRGRCRLSIESEFNDWNSKDRNGHLEALYTPSSVVSGRTAYTTETPRPRLETTNETSSRLIELCTE